MSGGVQVEDSLDACSQRCIIDMSDFFVGFIYTHSSKACACLYSSDVGSAVEGSSKTGEQICFKFIGVSNLLHWNFFSVALSLNHMQVLADCEPNCLASPNCRTEQNANIKSQLIANTCPNISTVSTSCYGRWILRIRRIRPMP